MKLIVVVALALVAVVASAPVDDAADKLVRSETVQNPDGGFSSSFETEKGIKNQVTGELKTVLDEEKKEHLVVVLRGSYSYTDKDDGHVETINYVADENGYRAEGPSVPVVPSRR